MSHCLPLKTIVNNANIILDDNLSPMYSKSKLKWKRNKLKVGRPAPSRRVRSSKGERVGEDEGGSPPSPYRSHKRNNSQRSKGLRERGMRVNVVINKSRSS